jgi:hypothetical protein
MNWIASYYDKNDKLIKTLLIKDRTEHEAEKEAMLEAPEKYDDWSLMPEDFFRPIYENNNDYSAKI